MDQQDPSDNPATLTLTIEGLSYTGAGWARLTDGRFVTVPHTLPGEEVRVRVGPFRRGRAFAEIEGLRARSPERVDPDCPYYDACSGCALRHIGVAGERAWKLGEAKAILARYGGIEEAEQPALDWIDGARRGARTRGRFSVEVEGEVVRLGLRGVQLRRPVVDIRTCPAQHQRFIDVAEAIGAALDARPSEAAALDTVEIQTAAPAGAEAVVTLSGDDLAPELIEAIDVAAQGAGAKLRRGDLDALALPLRHPTSGAVVEVCQGSWTHATPTVAGRLLTWIDARLHAIAAGGDAGRAALDLCAGVGTVSLHLLARGFEVTAVDEDRPGLLALARASGGRITVRPGRVGTILRKLRRAQAGPFDLVVINPMRRPLGAAQLGELEAMAPPSIIYLGPAPVSAARDLALLGSWGYRIARHAAVNLHPATATFMLAAHLVRV